MEPLAVRESSAKRLAVFLAGVGGVAFVGASFTPSAVTTPFGPGVFLGAHILLTGLALLAGILEWTRERMGEALATPTLLFAAVLTLIDLATGLWYYAPWLGVMTIVSIFGLVQRYLVRDEARHMSHGS
jgi:hypothetical protein